MGKKTEEIEVFGDIFAVFDYLKSKGWSISWEINRYYEAMQLYGDRYCAVPMPMQPLYRGQSDYYEVSKPSLYRKEWSFTEEIERELQLEDFKKMLDAHPEIAEYKHAGMEVNYEGLAQHYGIPTSCFDLTNSPLVASFFATTHYDSMRNEYRPVLEMQKKGVLYFFPMGAFENDFRDSKIWPIGLEALHRPGEQNGYSIECTPNDDLNQLTWHKFFFWHNPKASIRIYERCFGGKILFPFDLMAEKTRALTKYHVYSWESLEIVASKRNLSVDELQKLMENVGCRFLDILLYQYTESEKAFLKEEAIRKYPGNEPNV